MKANFRKAILFLLIAVMAISCTACGSGDANGASSAKETSARKAANTPAPEFRYVTKFIKSDEMPLSYVLSGFLTADGLYTYGRDASDETVSMPLFLSYDGKVKQYPAYAGPAFPEDEEGKFDYTHTDSIVTVQPMSSGNIFVLVTRQEYWNAEPAGQDLNDAIPSLSRDHRALQCAALIMDEEGKQVSTFPVEVQTEDIYVAMKALVTADDTILISLDNRLSAYSAGGDLLWSVEVDGSIFALTPTADGQICYAADSSKGKMVIPFDMQTQKPAENGVELPWDAFNVNAGCGGYDLCYSASADFCGIKLAAGETEKIFSWVECDVATDMDNPVYMAEDGSVYGYIYNSETGCRLFRVNKVPAAEVKEKKTLTFATLGFDYNYIAKEEILAFNQTNEEYRIEVKDYSQYGSGSDLSAGALKLQTEILSGNCPDIIDLSSIAADRLSAKGLLEDLYPYLDADPDLDRADFLPNVLAAAERNGKLISTVSSFSVESLAGVSAIVGDTPGWTYAEFNTALARMPDGCSAFPPNVTRKEVLDTCLMLDLDNYVDWSTGKCSFDSEQFVALLKFTKPFPPMPDLTTDFMEQFTRIATGEQMLNKITLDNFSTSWLNNIYFGDYPYTYVGYPTYDGEAGNYIKMRSGYAMSTACKNKEGAWQFLRTYFTEEYQRNAYELPSNKAAYDYQLQKAMTVTYKKDANGDYLLDENGEKIPQAIVDSDFFGKHIVYYTLSPEMAANLTSLAEGTTRILDNDVSILNIVDEQAEAFYQGQKSAEEVAKLVQSKVNIYVNEQR